jgi:CRISPR-associated protein (TIGR02710 family)
MLRGALFSVGGTPAPIIEALKNNPVDCALFVVSARSEEQVSTAILPSIGYSPQWECVLLSDPDDLNACYQQIRAALRNWIERRRLREEDIYFDLTGGTKPMSAALTLAAVERIPRYHYVSGEREKSGLGTVVTGTERPVTGLNPWTQIAIRQRELATSLFAQGHPEAAGAVLDQAATAASEEPETLKAYAGLCRTLARLDLFDFKSASRELGQFQPRLEIVFDQRRETRLLAWVRGLRIHLQELDQERSRQKDFSRSLLELLANAHRRGKQARYDDAIARLYRSVELFAQNRLHRAFGALSGRIPLDSLDPILADKLRHTFPDDHIENEKGGRLQLGCAKAFAALAYSSLEDDHQLPQTYERLKDALGKRNDSWLAHGTRPASASDFDEMWKLVLAELGIAAETLPDWPQIRFME